MKDRIPHTLSPHFFSSDEGPETGEDSEDDLVRSYLPQDRVFDGTCERMYDSNHIPAINITLHSPNANHVLEAEICQLADIQENIQRMREGEVLDHQSLESRLSTSCPSLAVEAANKNKRTKHTQQQRYRRRSDRNRSPSMSTGDSDEDTVDSMPANRSRNNQQQDHTEGRNRDRSSSLRPVLYQPGTPTNQHPVEAINQMAKSVSTPHIPAAAAGTVDNGNEEYVSTPSSKSSRRRAAEPTHVFIQKLIAEHGWTKQGSGTDSETEGDEGVGPTINHPPPRLLSQPLQHASPQLTLAEFLQNPALVEEDQRKRRRNKKERGGSLFSLRKKKDKKESTAGGGKGLTKAGSAASLSRPVNPPRVPQHSYSMSSIKRYPPPSSSQFYLARSESSKSTTEEREDVDGGDKENLLDSEILPSEEFPESFPFSFRTLDTDPFLRLQKEEPDTWANSVPPGVASALKPHEAKRQEHIYEFIMTEKHHCQLLKVIQKVFCEGMVSYLDMKPELLERLFPQLETLINIHFQFLRQLRHRQDSNSVIPTIADILLDQFHSDTAVRWQGAYGAFCSQHSDAVNIYKDLLKSDRRFHEFVQQSSLNPLLRKMGIPECILTVTTRITKYPLLIEPLIKTAKDRPEEQQKLRNCLHLVKNILIDVNGQVAEKERAQRLIEIYNRLEAKSYLQADGRKFKKSDFLLDNRKLLFEGVATLINPPTLNTSGGGGRGNRSPAPLLVNVVVLSDVLVFLQDVNQKYQFVSPENRTGLIPVHTLIAREKPGTENKALYIISTNDKEPEIYELSIAQPRDRQEWISGIRRAVDMSVGVPGEDSAFESESQQAKKQLEAKYMRLRQLTGELRGRDMELGRVLEDKMRLLVEILEEVGVDTGLPPIKYTPLTTEQEMSVCKEDLLRELQEASRLAASLYTSPTNLGRSVSSVGEQKSDGYESPSLPRRAETFGGFDTELGGRGKRSQIGGGEGGGELLLSLDKSQQAAVAQLTHHLNNIFCMVSEHFTSLQGLKVEVAECKERAALGWGRYKHNQQLEELRQLQEKLQDERRLWQQQKADQEKEFRQKQESMSKLQAALEQDKKDVEQQRDKLYRKLEALRAQGIDFAPNMTVIGAPSAPNPEPHFIMEVRKAVSPPTNNETGSSSNNATRKQTHATPPSQANLVNQNLISATIETKGDVLEVKQQIPSKLAKLSLAGSKLKDKKSSSNIRSSVSGSMHSINQSSSTPQLLPYKLSESESKKSTAGTTVSGSPKTGYQKLSSNSFAEERLGRPAYRDNDAVSHSRTGSSPASMSGRPMTSSNTLPKSSHAHQHHQRAESPEKQGPLVQRVNYADSGEEVFFF